MRWRRKWRTLLIQAILYMSCVCLLTLFIIKQAETLPSEPEEPTHSAQTMNNYTKDGTKTDLDECNVPEFKRLLNLTSNPPIVPRHLLAKCERVIYNRVPKCASRTMNHVFTALAEHNGYTALFLNRPYRVTETEYIKYVRAMREANDHFVLTSHFFFVDFTDVYDEMPVYINIIREPVDWFRSVYYWLMFGSIDDPTNEKLTVLNSTTIDDCARSTECVDQIRSIFGSMRFLCGQARLCSRANFTYSLLEAQSNLAEYYLTVGLQSDVSEYLEVLEYLLPHMFSGLSAEYEQIAHTITEGTRTFKKHPLAADTEQLLRNKLQLEYQLYHQVESSFRSMVDAVRKLRDDGRS